MELPYFKYSEIKNCEDTKDLNKFVAQFLLDFTVKEKLISSDLLDEEIELLFLKICELYKSNNKMFIFKNNSYIFHNVSNLRMNKLKSSYNEKKSFPSSIYDSLLINNYFESRPVYIDNKTFLILDGSEQLDYFVNVHSLIEYRYYSEGGLMYDKKKNGYLVFIEFKRKLKNFYNLETPEIDFRKEKGHRLNYKISLLEYFDVLKRLQNEIPSQRDRAEILAQIIGGSSETIEDYLDGKNTIKNDVKNSAIKFITDKIYK